MKAASTIVGTIVVLVLLLAVAVPIISDMQENSQDPIYGENSTGDGYLMSKGSTGSIVVAKTADGVTAGGSDVSTGYAIVTSGMVMEVTSSGFNVMSSGFIQACITTGDTLTVSGSTWSLSYTYTDPDTNETSTRTANGSFTWIYLPDASGKYLHAAAPVFVDGDSEIVVHGTTAASGRIVAKGTIDNGFSTVFKYSTGGVNGFTVSSEETDYTNTLTSVTVNFTSATSTFTSFIVPVDYTTGYQEGIVSSLIGIAPIILVAALVMALAFRMFPGGRREDDY